MTEFGRFIEIQFCFDLIFIAYLLMFKSLIILGQPQRNSKIINALEDKDRAVFKCPVPDKSNNF